MVVLAFEKLLLATAFTIAATMQSWGLVAAVGASHASFYLLGDLCILYHLLALPLNTSFHVKGTQESAIGDHQALSLFIRIDFRYCVSIYLLISLSSASI